MISATIIQGDWAEALKTLPDESVNCCVTSPPYWGLRDYGVSGQLGLEKTPEEYVAKLVDGFREVWRVLRNDGTLWLNLGDSYARNGGTQGGSNRELMHMEGQQRRMTKIPDCGLKEKDLVGVPWMTAFALRHDGWYLRSDIIWHKINPMPESVTDRPTKAHEYIFLFSKLPKYFYDAEAIKEPSSPDSHRRTRKERADLNHKSAPGKYVNGIRSPGVTPKSSRPGSGIKANESFHAAVCDLVPDRNKRTVWSVVTSPYPEAHFATYPPDLIKPCILAGCPAGGTVFDPFAGSGTTGQVALELGRNAILIELNPEYIELIKQRTNVTPGLALA